MLEEKNQVIIVCDKKRKPEANFLLQLLSADEGKGIEGSVWEEKFFLANEPTLSSGANIIFIGNFKSAKENMVHINYRYNEYGIRYGWHGKRAIITVENKLLSQNQRSNLVGVALKLKDDIEIKFGDSTSSNIPNWAKISIAALKSAPLLSQVFEGWTLFSIYKDFKNQIEQQYKIAVLKFFNEGISDFLGV